MACAEDADLNWTGLQFKREASVAIPATNYSHPGFGDQIVFALRSFATSEASAWLEAFDPRSSRGSRLIAGHKSNKVRYPYG
jgi:hypothetical protein